jgi:hypothetical protein
MGLWCHYSLRTLSQANGALSELGKWCLFALFGRHATSTEVSVWNKRCEEWLKEENNIGNHPIEGL